MSSNDSTQGKRKRGRPRKASEDLRDNRFEINLDAFWRRELEAFADAHDLPPRTAARVLLIKKLKEELNGILA